MATKPLVEIKGLAELRRDMLRLDRENVPKALVAAGMAAAEPVANRIRSVLPHLSGALRGTVRVAKVRTGASIRVGTARVPYTGPVEFGGWPGARPFVRGGRYIFPTAARLADDAVRRYDAELQRAIDHNGWETNPR